MRKISLLSLVFGLAFSLLAIVAYSQERGCEPVYTVTASPAENTAGAMGVTWATDTLTSWCTIDVAKCDDAGWKRMKSYRVEGQLCNTFHGVYSKSADGQNIYEDALFNKYRVTLEGLKSNTRYKYRIRLKDGAEYISEERHFCTSPEKGEWEACIISDFHVYAPLYARTESAMKMIGTVENYAPFDWVLHLGDITAWGGSYSFWRELYNEKPFKEYMWAGVNGNHDNMSRGYIKNTNEYFRDAAAYPMNGYEGEMGVCYFFKYGDVLFIMLNSESMRSDEGLLKAQEWVKRVVEENPARYRVVCEHYQWFFGKDGTDSQYGRWCELFDELGISLALAGNNHIYVSTPPIYDGECVGDIADAAAYSGVPAAAGGTVYIQTPSSDNERGVAVDLGTPLKENSDKIKFRWSEGPNTVGAMHLKVTKRKMVLTLLDRNGKVLDVNEVLPSAKR